MSKAYCTYRIKIANRERVQVEKWNSLHQPLGEPSGAFRYLEKLNELDPLLTRASNNELNSSNEVRRLGETLFDILFDDGLCRDFVGFYDQVVRQDEQLLRIELVIDEQGMPEVAALPWEFLCLPERENLGTIWLSTAPKVVFSRRRFQYFAAQPIQLQKGEKLRIALIVASPPDLPPVFHQPIQESLEKLAQEKVNLVELLPVLQNADPRSIDEVLSQAPHIVHFIGYCGLPDDQGQEVGVFLVDPNLNQALWVEADYFSELLNQYRPGLVILQAGQSGTLSASRAFTGVASRVLQQNIPVIVAMQYEVSDTVSSQFPRRFYEQLAKGDPVDIAAQYGRRDISLSPRALNKKRDFATPVIYMRVEDGYLFERYEEESPAPSSSIELRRRLEAAMPKQCQVEQPTEVRVMVALHDSPGLRANLPDYTKSGDLIEKNDVVQNDVPLEFPVDSKTQEPLPINIFVSLTAPGFKVEQSAKSIRVSPRYDSGIVTFFLTPIAAQKHSRVIVEWFGDEQKNTLLGSLTLITDACESQASLNNISWEIKNFYRDFGSAKLSNETAENSVGSHLLSAQASSQKIYLRTIASPVVSPTVITTLGQVDELQQFISQNPDLQQELQLLEQVRAGTIPYYDSVADSQNRNNYLSLLEAQLPYNCEHVVPQSWFNERQPMKGDLHHLFACEGICNSYRGITPYFDFADFEEVIRDKCGKSERNEFKFEPSNGKGEVARATFYFLLRYPGKINNTIEEYKADRLETLLRWHQDFAITDHERHRNMAIFKKQGNRNPLIDFPEWARKIDFTLGLG